MGSIAAGERTKMLDAMCRGVAYDNDEVWVKRHLGDPGAAGTSNPAADTTRVQASFSAASAGAITNNADVEFPSVTTTETYTHVSLWSASTGGTFLGSDDLNASAVMQAGDDFVIPAGDLDIAIT